MFVEITSTDLITRLMASKGRSTFSWLHILLYISICINHVYTSAPQFFLHSFEYLHHHLKLNTFIIWTKAKAFVTSLTCLCSMFDREHVPYYF